MELVAERTLKPAPAADVRPRLLYATPTGRHPHLGYVASAMASRMTQKRFRHDFGDFMFAAGPVQMARCHIAREVIAKGYDYVLMHDDDLQIAMDADGGSPLDSFLGLMESDPKIGVIGAVYLREDPRCPTVNMWHPLAKSTQDAPGESVNAICNLPRGPFTCAGVGTGYMMIRAQVFRDIDTATGGIEPFMFWPYVSQWGAPSSMGEDYYFCWRAQQAGWKVIADPRFTTIHDKDASGKLVYQQYEWDPPTGKPDLEHKINAPTGSKVITVDGISCLDVSDIRRKDGEAATARKAA